MRHNKVLLCVMVVAFMCAMPISAEACETPPDYLNPYDGAWLPVDGLAFLVETSDTSSCASLFLYEFDNPKNQLQLFTDGFYSNATVYFTLEDNSWYADTTPGGQALAFTEAPVFGFSFDECGTSWFEYYLSPTDGDALLLFERNTGMEVVVNGMAPVPIPPAVLLLGSGLIGIVSLRRRK